MSQPTSPTQSTEVPEEAIDKAGEALCESLPPGLELWGGAWIEDPLADEWGDWAAVVLQAAATALRKQGADQERQRLKEALLSEDALTAIFGGEYGEEEVQPLRELLDALEADRG
jgi:hypothetical protein